MNIKIERAEGRVILHCEGRLVLGHETDLLCCVMRQVSREIVVGLREVTAMDAAGVGALISLQAAGFYLTLADPTPTVLEILARTNLDSVFEITGTGCFGGRPSISTLDRAVV